MKHPIFTQKQIIIFGALICLSTTAFAAKITREQQAMRDAIEKKALIHVGKKMNGIVNAVPAIRADLGEHFIDGESEAIDKTTVDVVRTVLKRAFDGTTPGVVKGDHGKSIACLSGSIEFFKDIPADFRKGVVVPGAVYQVESRISNAEEPSRSDRSSTSQGVALKLKNVSKHAGNKARLNDFADADEQDFLMTSAPIFFLSNIVEYSVAFGLRAGGAGITGAIGALAKNPALFGRLGTEALAKMRAWTSLAPGKPANIMTHPYWSKHPYAWGEKGEPSRAAKYSVAPCENAKGLTASSSKEDYQKEFITESFEKNREICFYFRAQLRPVGATEKEYPIEDGNVEWLEAKAPFVNLAKVTLPAEKNRDWSSQAAQTTCARTEFSPWNGLVAHQPMSNLARGRRYVYKASALVRELKEQLDPEITRAKQ